MELCSPLCFISSLMTFVKNLPFFRYILTQRIDQSDFHFQSGLLFITEQKCISHPGQCQACLASPNMMLLLMRSYSIHAFSEVANSQSLSIDTMNSEVIYGSCAASQKAEVVFFILKQCLPHCLSWGKQLTFIGLADKYDVQLVCHILQGCQKLTVIFFIYVYSYLPFPFLHVYIYTLLLRTFCNHQTVTTSSAA